MADIIFTRSTTMKKIFVSVGHPALENLLISGMELAVPEGVTETSLAKQLRKTVAENAGKYGFIPGTAFEPVELYWTISEEKDGNVCKASDNYYWRTSFQQEQRDFEEKYWPEIKSEKASVFGWLEIGQDFSHFVQGLGFILFRKISPGKAVSYFDHRKLDLSPAKTIWHV
jgi:hypothetical protein